MSALIREKTIGALVSVVVIAGLLALVGFNTATSGSAAWSLAFAATMLLFMSLQLPLDITAQARKEMFQGKVAPDPAGIPGSTPPVRSLWRSVMPRAVPVALAAAGALCLAVYLLDLAGIVLPPVLLTVFLVVAAFIPIAMAIRRTLPAALAGHAGFLTALAVSRAVPGSRYLLAEHWAPRLVLMTAVNLVLGLMIAQGQAGKVLTAAQAQSDWGVTFLILLVFTFSSAADYAAGDVWSGRHPLSKRKGRLGPLAILVLLVAVAYAGGFAYQTLLSVCGVSALSPLTSLLYKMVGVWLGTILGCWIGVSWIVPRASRKVRDRMAYRG